MALAFTLPHFSCIATIFTLLNFLFPLLLVSADDSSTECPYPCLPAPVVPVTNCPPPPPPQQSSVSPVTGYWSYPPPPPSMYNPYFSPPNMYNMNPSPPPPNPILPWYPWYYINKGQSISKASSVFSQGSLGRFNVILLSTFAVLMIH